MIGKITKQISNDYTVRINDDFIVCKARGKFRKLGISPIVGDNVKIDLEDKYIIEIIDRINELKRPIIANVDQAVIVTSTHIPNFSSELLDKLLCIIEFNNIKPIICFTKLDLLNSEELDGIINIEKYYRSIGYEVYNNTDEKIKEIFKNKITVFTGQSGSGKSTLLNRLDDTLNIKVGEVSKALGRGRHTTRHTELLETLGGYIADTPGFSSIDFKDMNVKDIRDNFIEFNEYKDKCRYKDCMHYKEDNCEVKNKVEDNVILRSRYNNYLKFIRGEYDSSINTRY